MFFNKIYGKTIMENPLSKYKDMFGKVGEGIHSYRMFGIAIFDLLFTILGAWLFSIYAKISFWISLGSFLILGIIAHHIFCVRTTVDKLLFREPKVHPTPPN